MASAMGAAGMNDATAQMGLQFGSHVLGAGQNYVEQTVRPAFSAVLAPIVSSLFRSFSRASC